MISYKDAIEFVQPTSSKHTQDVHVEANLRISVDASAVAAPGIYCIHDGILAVKASGCGVGSHVCVDLCLARDARFHGEPNWQTLAGVIYKNILLGNEVLLVSQNV